MFINEISSIKKSYKAVCQFWKLYSFIALTLFMVYSIIFFIAYSPSAVQDYFITFSWVEMIHFCKNIVATNILFNVISSIMPIIIGMFHFCWAFQIVHGRMQSPIDILNSNKAGYTYLFSKKVLTNLLYLLFFNIVFFTAVFLLGAGCVVIFVKQFDHVLSLISPQIQLALQAIGVIYFFILLCFCIIRLFLVPYLVLERPKSSLRNIVKESILKTQPHTWMLARFMILTALSITPLIVIINVIGPCLMTICLAYRIPIVACVLFFATTAVQYALCNVALPVLNYMYMAHDIIHGMDNNVKDLLNQHDEQ